MQVKQVKYADKIFFGNRFKLEDSTIKLIEKKTRLSYDEMTTLPIDEVTKLIKRRVPIDEKIKQGFANIKLSLGKICKNIGEKLGLFEKQHVIYTDIN